MQASTSKFMRGGNLYEHCRICNSYIPKNVIRDHNLSSQHIDKANSLYADSPVVEIQGMGRQISLEDCHKFLLSFGNIENIVLRVPKNPSVVRVTFQKSEDTKCLKNSKDPIYYKGNKLLAWAVYSPGTNKNTINTDASTNNENRKNKSVPNRKKDKTKNKFLPMSVKEAINLDLSGSFDSQLATLMIEVRLKVSGVFMMREVCEDIEYVLKRIFPGCEVSPFGSVVTGLAFEGSDFDCYCNTNKARQWANTSKSDDFKILHKARKAFYAHPSIFQNITFIPHAKVPLIRLKHIRTNVNVDINFKSPFGVANGNLMRHLLSSDERILHLAIFVKYWAKSLSFIGTNRFTSYNMLLLVIFYLQNIDQPIIPPISQLQQDPRCENHLGDWNVGFSKDILLTNQNNEDVLSLIDGFFEFYSNFKFNNVICPFLGKSFPTEKFVNLDLPQEFQSFVQKVNNENVKNLSITSSIILQDPIELNKNCSAAVNDTMLTDFIRECKASSYIVKKALKNNDYSNLIVKLTSFCKFIPDNSVKTHSFLLPFKMRNPRMEPTNTAVVNKISSDVKRIVEYILSDIVKCKYTTSFDKKSNNTVYPNLSFHCEAFYDLWSNRYKKPNGLPTLDEEVSISQAIINSLIVKEKPQEPIFKFSLNFCIKGKVCDINIVSQHCKKTDIFCYFVEVMVPIIEIQLRQYEIQ